MAGTEIIELRQYTLFGGRRDTLIDLFERRFIDSQDAVGARVLGSFRDLDDADRFVWLRGFDSMAARAAALAAFYDGPMWQAHRTAANATMLDSDNVLLLRAADAGGLPTRDAGAALVSATIHYLGTTPPAHFAAFFEAAMRRRLDELGAAPFATFVSERSRNNFPRLPVRENESVFVWFAAWRDARAEADFMTRLARLSGWRDRAPADVLPALMRKPERLRLAPTARSPLR